MARRRDQRAPKLLRVLLTLAIVLVVVAIVATAVSRKDRTKTTTAAESYSGTTTTTTAGGGLQSTSTTGSGASIVTSGDGTAQSGSEPQTVYNQVLYDIKDSGNDSVGFVVSTAASRWQVGWTYDCSDLAKKGSFGFVVKIGTRVDLNDPGPHKMGTGGSGLEHYYDTGRLKLSVTSKCAWTIKIVEVE